MFTKEELLSLDPLDKDKVAQELAKAPFVPELQVVGVRNVRHVGRLYRSDTLSSEWISKPSESLYDVQLGFRLMICQVP